jgi:hypothetical protein
MGGGPGPLKEDACLNGGPGVGGEAHGACSSGAVAVLGEAPVSEPNSCSFFYTSLSWSPWMVDQSLLGVL